MLPFPLSDFGERMLDGGGHNYIDREIHDQVRANFLADRGILILRFWNHQLRREFDSVLEAIWFELEQRCGNNPSPQSSPFEKGRGGSREHAVTKDVALKRKRGVGPEKLRV